MIGMAPAAMAQYGSKPPDVQASDLAFRAGFVLPIDGTLHNVSSSFIGAGVEYTFEKQYLPNAMTYIAAEWIGKSSAGGHGNIFPVTLNERFYFSAQRQNAFYVLGGIGAFFCDTGNSSQTTLGIRGGVGYNLGQSIFTELDGFVTTPAPGGLKPSGVGIYLGYRF
jgi:hypothetical protein